jgi:hypothetical protein
VASLVLAGSGLPETLGRRPIGLDLGHCDVLSDFCDWPGRRLLGLCAAILNWKIKRKKSFKCSQENGWFIPMQPSGSWLTLLASSILLQEKQIPPIA